MTSFANSLKEKMDVLQIGETDFRNRIDSTNFIYHALTHLSSKQCEQLSVFADQPKYQNHLLMLIENHIEMPKEIKIAIIEVLSKPKHNKRMQSDAAKLRR
jgi:hypothetical protein